MLEILPIVLMWAAYKVSIKNKVTEILITSWQTAKK